MEAIIARFADAYRNVFLVFLGVKQISTMARSGCEKKRRSEPTMGIDQSVGQKKPAPTGYAQRNICVTLSCVMTELMHPRNKLDYKKKEEAREGCCFLGRHTTSEK